MAHARKLLLATAVVPGLLAATPARADSPSGWIAGSSKTEAIIGAPSALAAILAEQNAPERAVALRPAAYRAEIQNTAMASAKLPQQDLNVISPAVFSGKPDIFGTVALQVRHTPLDSKWKHVENARVNGAAAAYAASLRSTDERGRLEAINSYVNRRVHFVDDERQYGRADVWSTATSTLRRGQGDCEDYAVAKIQMLRSAGFSDRDLYLVVLRDLVRRADHAVAVVRSGEHMYVLDNGTDELLDSETISDYRPILTFSVRGTWTHGYRVIAPISVASANSLPIASTISAAAGVGQRSRSASLLAFNTGLSR